MCFQEYCDSLNFLLYPAEVFEVIIDGLLYQKSSYYDFGSEVEYNQNDVFMSA